MKLYTYILAACAAAISLGACNDIGPNDRFIELPPVEAQRVVLLEEYTGQKCVNCPTAHEVIENLLAQYADTLIVVSIHGGGDANSYNESKFPAFGLANEQSEAYVKAAGIGAFPKGVVNRATGVQSKDEWAASIREQKARPSNLEMTLAREFNADSTAMTITANLSAEAKIDGYLQLWIVESGIVAPQYLPDGSTNRRYVHNHVFRSAVNGQNGERIALAPREDAAIEHNIELKENWKAANLSVVAFVYNENGVMQACQL